MAALAPIAPLLSGIGTAVSVVKTLSDGRRASSAQAEATRQQQQAQAESYEQQKRKLEQQRRETLARAKARFAASGGGLDGSHGAFLTGVSLASDQEGNDLYQSYQSKQVRRNLLDDGGSGNRLQAFADLLKIPLNYNRYY